MATILITGGSGLIGRNLTQALLREGHAVRWLSRDAIDPPGATAFRWDVGKGSVDSAALDGVDHIVHLAGAGIADKRWSSARLRTLIDSRAASARLLLRACERHGFMPRSFISAAGIGYYGAVTTPHRFTENDAPGTDTIARISVEWERAAEEWRSRCRVVKLRTPIVLARDGGALPQLARPFRLGLGAPLGSGAQWMPWVHIDDLCAIYQQAIRDERLSGTYNVVAGQHTNRAFTQAVAMALKRPLLLPALPGWVLRIALGELAVLLLRGSQVEGERLRGAGFIYRFEELPEALADLLSPAITRDGPSGSPPTRA